MNDTRISGVYEIVHIESGKRYIGSSVTLEKRLGFHRRSLIRNKHHSRHLQAAWNKYGDAAFQFNPLLFCSTANLLIYEQLLIDGLRPEYNMFPNARSPLGYRHSEETKAKLRGRQRTPEHCKALSAAQKGKPRHTPASLKRMSETMLQLGIKPPSQKGKPQSAEHRARIAAAMIGNKNTLGYKPTPETLAKKSALMMGNTYSRGYKYSEEQKMVAYASRRKK